MLHVYGIRNCDTVKKALAWLDDHGTKYTFHDFKKETLTPAQLDVWLKAAGWETLLNRKGTTWRGLPEKVRETVDAKSARTLMLENPSIIKRPVIVQGKTVSVGFDADDFSKRYR
ncbi:MAG: ArsC family reductase [Pseudomonadota bacterium]